MQTDYILQSSRWEHPLNAQTKNNYTAIVVYCLYHLGTTQQLNCAHVDVLLYYDFFYYNDHFKLVASLLPHSDIYLLHRPFQARSRGCVQTKTFRKGSEASLRAEGGRLGMRAAYNNFAPTGGSYQSVFRGTLPRRTASGVRGAAIARRHSIRCLQYGNTSTLCCANIMSCVIAFSLLPYCFSAGACPIILMYER